MSRKKLPESFKIKVNYDKKIKVYWAECVDNPNINAIASDFPRLIINLHASIFDQYHIKVKKIDRVITNTFFPVPSPLYKIKQKIAIYIPTLRNTSDTINLTSSPVSFAI